MPPELLTAVISASVALATSVLAGLITWLQIRREARKWAIDLRAAIELEHLKIRIPQFAQASEIIGRLSSTRAQSLGADELGRVGQDLNSWFYSAGGLCADKSTRGAILGLRDACLKWTPGKALQDVWGWRDAALFYLRRDIHLGGLDTFDPKDTASSLAKLREEMREIAT